MSTIGYARVSTRDPNPDCQEHALLKAAAVLMRDDNKNVQQIAKVLGVGRKSVSRALARFDGGTQ